MHFFDPSLLIQTLGLIGIFTIVFAESGILIGMFFPGDSLLFTAGILASQGTLPLIPLLLGTSIAAILGDSVGYFFGAKVGPRIFTKEDSLFFNKKYIHKAQSFYEKYGTKTIIIARFIPIIRTLAPIVAGVGKMKYSVFLTYNIIGGIVWSVGVTLLGYVLGSIVPNIDQILLPLLFGIVFISIIPGVIDILRHRK